MFDRYVIYKLSIFDNHIKLPEGSSPPQKERKPYRIDQREFPSPPPKPIPAGQEFSAILSHSESRRTHAGKR